MYLNLRAQEEGTAALQLTRFSQTEIITRN